MGLALYNGAVFVIYGIDKWRARRGSWRVSEATLLWLALLGGGAGGLAGIYLLRHKTRKPRFALGVPLILATQTSLLLWLLSR